MKDLFVPVRHHRRTPELRSELFASALHETSVLSPVGPGTCPRIFLHLFSLQNQTTVQPSLKITVLPSQHLSQRIDKRRYHKACRYCLSSLRAPVEFLRLTSFQVCNGYCVVTLDLSPCHLRDTARLAGRHSLNMSAQWQSRHPCIRLVLTSVSNTLQEPGAQKSGGEVTRSGVMIRIAQPETPRPDRLLAHPPCAHPTPSPL